MTDVWFYHLQGSTLDQVLPSLLERSLGRGWRAVVQATSPERVEALDTALWTYEAGSFLAHGTVRDGDAALQPVVLTEGPENPNGAAIRFLIEGAEALPALAQAGTDYQRVALVFDGNDEIELLGARRQWSALRAAGHTVSYWQQNEDGRWDKRG